MTRLVQFANNAVSRLAGNITNIATTLAITPGDGAKFPALGAGEHFAATLVKADGTLEIVKQYAISMLIFKLRLMQQKHQKKLSKY